MVSKNFLFAPLPCSVLLTGAPKSENGFRIHCRGDWPLDGSKISDIQAFAGAPGASKVEGSPRRTTGVLGGKRDWETKSESDFLAAERQRAEVRVQSCPLPALSSCLERSISCSPVNGGLGRGGIAR